MTHKDHESPMAPRLTRRFVELPAILALDGAEQSIDIPAHSQALLRAREARPDTLLDLIPPPSRIRPPPG